MREIIYSLSEIPEVIKLLPKQFEQNPGVVTVTEHGKPLMRILPAASFDELMGIVESLLETLEVMQDQEVMAAFRQGVKDIEEGRGKPFDEVLKELGWE